MLFEMKHQCRISAGNMLVDDLFSLFQAQDLKLIYQGGNVRPRRVIGNLQTHIGMMKIPFPAFDPNQVIKYLLFPPDTPNFLLLPRNPYLYRLKIRPMIDDSTPALTPLSELGEFGLIDRLTAGLKHKQASTRKGVGDDAAVLQFGEKAVLVSKDLLIENIHFDLSYYPLRHLGYKAAVVNISDIVAMNGRPTQMLVGMAISAKFSVEAVEEIFAGIRLACERYEVDLVGGDTTSSSSGLVLSITIIGEADPSEVVYRNTARANDLICVSGDLGGAYAGLLLLEREKQVFKANPEMQPDLEGNDYVLERQLKPEARLEVLDILRQSRIKPTAMIDISDGLSSEAIHLCTSSGLGCTLFAERIPLDPVTVRVIESFEMDPLTAALNGGEDYELLFTIPLEDHDKVKDITGIHLIGHMTEATAGMYLEAVSGARIPLTSQGWDAYLKKDTPD